MKKFLFFAFVTMLILGSLLAHNQPGPAWADYDTPTPGTNQYENPTDDKCRRLGLPENCKVPSKYGKPATATPTPSSVPSTATPGATATATASPTPYTPPADWKCNRVWTSEKFQEDWADSHRTVSWLQSQGWSQIWELEDFAGGYPDPQDRQVQWVLSHYAPFTQTDLLMVDYSSSAWWNTINPNTVISLTEAVQQGLNVLFINEYPGFSGVDVANFLDDLPPDVIYNRYVDHIIEPDPNYQLQPWMYDMWFYGTFADTAQKAGAHTASGNYFGDPNKTRVWVWSPTNHEATLVYELQGLGSWRFFADSTGVGDDALYYYGDGQENDLAMQSLIWGCRSSGGQPAEAQPPTPTPTETATPAPTWTPTETRTPTPTWTPSITPTWPVCRPEGGGGCITATPSMTATSTDTPTETATATITATERPTGDTPTPDWSTPAPTLTPTWASFTWQPPTKTPTPEPLKVWCPVIYR
jgi:hypothetical protein